MEKTLFNNYFTGALESPKDVRDYRPSFASGLTIPDEYEIDLVVKVKNQGSVGSCVAHAISSLNEWFNYKECSDDTIMSTGFIYGNRRNTLHKGSGMYIRNALKGMCYDGNVPNSMFSYNVEVPDAISKFEETFESLKDIALPYRFKSYVKLNSETEIKKALMSTGPVVFSIRVYDDTHLENGMLTSKQNPKDKYSGHCMLIYGWNSDGWLVRNSWGENWGNKGNCILPYDYTIKEAWTVVDDSNENVEIKKPFHSAIGSVIAKILNFLYKIIGLCKK